jgi:alpha-glucosidase
MVESLEKIAETAAKYKMLVDYHGAFKPAGIERVWPNIINYEGVKGNENNKWSANITPEHNVTIPFIRMATGPIDFTPGSMVNTNLKNYAPRFTRPMSLGTRCHQVAMYVVFDAPLQMLCESPTIYNKEQETVDFITQIPTVWDETKVLEGSVSNYIIVARRKGDNWYVGGMTDWTPREFTVDLSFLTEGSYSMELMQDGINASKNAQDYKIKTMDLENTTTALLNMAPGGGWVAIISKK